MKLTKHPPWQDKSMRAEWFVWAMRYRLTDRERFILKGWLEGRSATEISDDFQVTRARIEQVLERAIQKLSRITADDIHRRALGLARALAYGSAGGDTVGKVSTAAKDRLIAAALEICDDIKTLRLRR